MRPVACRAQRAPAGHFRADTRAGTRRLGELSGRLTWWRGFSGAPLPWGPLHPTCRSRRGCYPPDGRSFTTGGGSRRRDRAAESATENWRDVCRSGSLDFTNHPRRPFTYIYNVTAWHLFTVMYPCNGPTPSGYLNNGDYSKNWPNAAATSVGSSPKNTTPPKRPRAGSVRPSAAPLASKPNRSNGAGRTRLG